MSSFICWCHVFLGRPRLVPGIASSITLRVTLVASRLWTCPDQRRRPLRITSSIGERCNMRRISSFRIMISSRHSRGSREASSSPWLAIVLLLVTFIAQHSLPYVRAGLIMVSLVYLRFEPEGNLPVIQNSGQFSPAWPCSLHAKDNVSVDGAIFINRWSQVFEMVNILQFFSIQFDWQWVFPLLGCQNVQLDPFTKSKMAASQHGFGQCLTFYLYWLESCNITFYWLLRAASTFLMLVLQLGNQNPTWPPTFPAK